MFALEVEYLTDRAVATARHSREVVEWPPHPGRMFSALVAALHESDLTDDERQSARAGLLWVESQPPPSVAVSDADSRSVATAFVPVNDPKDLDSLPDKRGKQARYFPSARPTERLVHFIWPAADGIDRHRPALERLAGEVTYLGHSSSLVRVAVTDAPRPVSFEPGDGKYVFRVPSSGRLEELERLYSRQARPTPGTYVAYRRINEQPRARPPATESVFGDMIVAQLGEGPFLPLSGALKLTAAVRGAVLKATDAADARVKSLVSGHTSDGGLSRENHVAYIPLANVGYPYSDGRVMGFAAVLPRGLNRYSTERREVVKAVASLEGIGFGGYSWSVTLVAAGEGPKSLQPVPFLVGPSRRWMTVTPVLCDRFPKDRNGQREVDVIADSVERVCGVRPVRVEVGKVSKVRGVPPSHAFARERREGDIPRHRAHVLVEFDREVRGPIIAGAGRFMGMGLFRISRGEGDR
jgi:CRISPR-associated protein Csb2